MGAGLLALGHLPADIARRGRRPAPGRAGQFSPSPRYSFCWTPASWSMDHRSITPQSSRGQIRFDQGQNTYRGALGLLKRRESCTAVAPLLDIYAYRVRLPDRADRGGRRGPHLPPSARSRDASCRTIGGRKIPDLRRILLPEAEGNGAAGREVSLLRPQIRAGHPAGHDGAGAGVRSPLPIAARRYCCGAHPFRGACGEFCGQLRLTA